MNWKLAIEINRRALLRLLRHMLEMAGSGETVTRAVHRAVIAILLPAEAAARRLVAVRAQGLPAVAGRGRRAGGGGGVPPESRKGLVRFGLFDPRRYAGPPRPKRSSGGEPNVWGLDGTDTRPPLCAPTKPDDPVTARHLLRRLEALGLALNDIDGQARRLNRISAAMDRPIRPMRPGRPPGHRAVQEGMAGWRVVDGVLADCHDLALLAYVEPVVIDTS
jgi:hypothetical protein